MCDYQFIELQSEHVPQVAELESLCFMSGWSVGTIKSLLHDDNSHFYCVITDDRIIGYGGVRIIFDEANLDNIAIHPDFQKKGLGQKLLAFLIDLCKEYNVKTLMLEVRQSNESAIKLYEKTGFYVVGKRKDYYSNPIETALLMNLEVDK